MPTFTVHEPPPRKDGSVAAPERFVFVRDGFHFWAFALAPFWLLMKRLWLAFFLYAVFNVIIAVALTFMRAPSSLRIAVMLAIALAVGLEASSIWRWTLTRRRRKTLGFVVGEDREVAERRFFAEWTRRAAEPESPPPSEPLYSSPVWRGKPSGSDVIGLFPEPGNPPTGMLR
jgi:hypothetical protein